MYKYMIYIYMYIYIYTQYIYIIRIQSLVTGHLSKIFWIFLENFGNILVSIWYTLGNDVNFLKAC